MTETTLTEVSEIMDSFDIEEITNLIKSQLGFDNDDPDIFNDIKVDHLKPLYYKYAKLTKYNLDEGTHDEAVEKFIKICKIFMEQIFIKFNLKFNNEWSSWREVNIIPAVTLAIYDFFVLNFVNNIYTVMVNYLTKNKDDVYKTFEDMKNKKDASTLSNKKVFTPEMALIVSNIYNISEWIFMSMNEDDFLNYMDDSYIPSRVIKNLYKNGIISGDFMSAISDIITGSSSLRSTIGFKFISMVKNGEMRDLFKPIEIEES